VEPEAVRQAVHLLHCVGEGAFDIPVLALRTAPIGGEEIVPSSATDADSSNVKSRDTDTGAALHFVFSGAAVSVIDLNCTLG